MTGLTDPFPPELNDPVTAWPYLRRRFPWLFSDKPEEATPSTPKSDIDRVYYDVLAIAQKYAPKDLSLADISEVLTKDRYYSGSTYKRVKDVYDLLFSSSPVEDKPEERMFVLQKAA
jgi:hypothetical protein